MEEPERHVPPRPDVLGDPLLRHVRSATAIGDGHPPLHLSVYSLDLVRRHEPPHYVERDSRTSASYPSGSSIRRRLGQQEACGPVKGGACAQLPFNKRHGCEDVTSGERSVPAHFNHRRSTFPSCLMDVT